MSGWGDAIKKLECVNHACKCYRAGLEKLVQVWRNLFRWSYKMTVDLQRRWRRQLASCAIRMRSKEPDREKKQWSHLREISLMVLSIILLAYKDIAQMILYYLGTTPHQIQDVMLLYSILHQIIFCKPNTWRGFFQNSLSNYIYMRDVWNDDIQTISARLVVKAGQLIDNVTTSIAD